MKARLLVGLAFAVVAAVAIYLGLLDSGSPPIGHEYVATGTGSTALIRWSPSGGRLDGTMTLVTLFGAPPNQATSTRSIPVSATLDGSMIGVSFNAGPERFGTLSGDTFNVEVPRTDGILVPLQFTSNSSSAFNREVSRLQHQARAANASYYQATTEVSDRLMIRCQAAGGRIQSGGSTSASSDCVVGGVADPISEPETPKAAFRFLPSMIHAVVQGCQSVGGSWHYDGFSGYYTNHTDWDCTVGGFKDQVISFTTGAYDVPIKSAPAVSSLISQCQQSGGDFVIDSLSTARPEPFACQFSGLVNDDLAVTPTPHFVTPLSQASAQTTPGESAPTAPAR